MAIGSEDERSPPTLGRQDAPGHATDHVQPLVIDVQHGQLVDGEPVRVGREPLDELRRVGAAGAHDGDLHAHRVLRLPMGPNPRVKCRAR